MGRDPVTGQQDDPLSSVVMWEIDLTGPGFTITDAYYRQLGYEPGEVDPSWSWWESQIHPDDVAATMAIGDQILLSEITEWNNTYRIRAKDGTWIWILSRGSVVAQNDDGTPLRIIASNTDITSQIRTQELLLETQRNLERRQRQLSSKAGIAGVGMFEFDPRGGTVHATDTYFTMLGYEPGEFDASSERWRDNIHPDHREHVIAAGQALISGEAAEYDEELLIRTKSGEWKWIATSARPVEWDPDGRPTLIYGARIDIDERKRAELAIEEARKQLALAVEARDSLIASVAHELRTPLSVVSGYLSILTDQQSSGFDPYEREELTALAATEASELTQLIDDLLEFSRMGKPEPSATRTDLKLRPLVTGIATGIQLPDFEIHGQATARTVGHRVRQIVRNLLTNAVKYGGPSIRVHLSESDTAVVEVRDNGAGIDQTLEEQVFQPYQRGHDTPTMPGSLGLGLTIARDIAGRLDGDLTYRREDGWTVFSLTLPLPDDAAN